MIDSIEIYRKAFNEFPKRVEIIDYKSMIDCNSLSLRFTDAESHKKIFFANNTLNGNKNLTAHFPCIILKNSHVITNEVYIKKRKEDINEVFFYNGCKVILKGVLIKNNEKSFTEKEIKRFEKLFEGDIYKVNNSVLKANGINEVVFYNKEILPIKGVKNALSYIIEGQERIKLV